MFKLIKEVCTKKYISSSTPEIERSVNSIVEHVDQGLFADRRPFSVASLDSPCGKVNLLAHSGFCMGDGSAPDQFSAIFDRKVQERIHNFDSRWPARCGPMHVEDLHGE